MLIVKIIIFLIIFRCLRIPTSICTFQQPSKHDSTEREMFSIKMIRMVLSSSSFISFGTPYRSWLFSPRVITVIIK